MLKIFNTLKPFFEDNYKRYNVREYARLSKISPPSASKFLSRLHKEGLLVREIEKNYLYFSANKDDKLFISLSRAYWLYIFEKAGLTDFFGEELVKPLVILFGSFSKAEINENSDIDLAIFSASEKKINLEKFEKKLGRTIQQFVFTKKEDVPKELIRNIMDGLILVGGW